MGIKIELKPIAISDLPKESHANCAAPMGRTSPWVNICRGRLRILISHWLAERESADEIGDFDRAEILNRKLIIFRGFLDSLDDPIGAAEMVSSRAAIAQIIDSAERTMRVEQSLKTAGAVGLDGSHPAAKRKPLWAGN